MVNVNLVIEKMKKLKGINSKKEVAVLLRLSPADFSNRLKRETLLPLIVDWAVNEDVNLDWLLKDKKSEKEEDHQMLIHAYDAASNEAKKHARMILQSSAEESKTAGLEG